jgi:serine protease Do
VPGEAALRAWNLRQTPVVDVVRRVKEAVVNIHSERTVRADTVDELFAHAASQHRVNGMGTGIVLDPRGYIVTNQHVVDDVSLLRVRLADGTTLPARIIARDPENDLALIKINPPRPLPVMPLGTARDLFVGETVVAIGNAYGYDHTVTVGVVSAVGRDVTLNKEVRYKSLIQTDAAINPGNSGGPLVNVYGELVGVNVAIRAGAQGIGFAIPVDTMIRSSAGLLARTRQLQGALPIGVALRDEVDLDRPGPGHTITRQAVVDTVDPETPATRAGLRPGDVLVRVGDQPITSTLDLQRALLERDSGRLALVVRRENSNRELSLELQPSRATPVLPRTEASQDAGNRLVRPSPPEAAAPGAGSSPDKAAPAPVKDVSERLWQQLGVRLAPVGADVVARQHPQLHGGLAITEVRPETLAARAGFRAGDILVGLHTWEMLTTENVRFVLDHPDRATFSPVRFYILRAGQIHRGSLLLPD